MASNYYKISKLKSKYEKKIPMKEWRKERQKSWVYEVSVNIKGDGMHSMTEVQRANAERIVDQVDMRLMGVSAHKTVICICVLILRLGGKEIRLSGKNHPPYLRNNGIDEFLYKTVLEGLMRNFLKN